MRTSIYLWISFILFFAKTADGYNLYQEKLSRTDTAVVIRYFEKAKPSLHNNHLDSVDYYYKKGGQYASLIGYANGVFRYGYEYTEFLYGQLRYKEALEVASLQKTWAEEKHNIRVLADAYNNLGAVYQALGKSLPAVEHNLQSLKLSELLHDKKSLQRYYSNLSSIFIDLRDKQKSLYYAKKGYNLVLESKDSAMLAINLVNLAASEMINEQYPTAINHLNELITIAHKIKNDDRLLDAYANLGEIYNMLGQYDVSLSWYSKAFNAISGKTLPDWEAYILFGMASVHYNLKSYERASDYFTRSEKKAAQHGFSKNELKDLYMLGSQIKEAINDPIAALSLRKKYDALKDSIMSETLHLDIRDLEEKYQMSEKAKAISQQQLVIAEHQNEIQRKNKWIIIFIALGIILWLGTLIIVIWYKYREHNLRSESEKKILLAQLQGEEKERARQAKELHDGVASLLSAAKLQLDVSGSGVSSQETNQLVNSLLTQAVVEVRNISHNLAPEILLESGLIPALKDFCLRVKHKGLRIDFNVYGDIPNLEDSFQLTVYRVVQESVNNILKHAKASEAMIEAIVDSDSLSINIEDNGTGFNLNDSARKGIGLKNLFSRINSVGGKYDIRSVEGQGTTISLHFDISNFAKNKGT